MREFEQVQQFPEKEYRFIIEGKTVHITLKVDNRDIIYNADGKIDCPLETVMRKSNFTFSELNKWGPVTIRFVRIIGEREITLNKIEHETILSSIQF